MSAKTVCPVGADSQLGPRVAFDCRAFDFTLLFEDIFFGALPAAVFLLIVGVRIRYLQGSIVKVIGHKLAVSKLSLLALLFILQILFTAFVLETPSIHTKASASSGVLNIFATFAAVVLSYLEDQRSCKPSDILVFYFSVLGLLEIPRLRSLWMTPSVEACQGLWTAIFVVTISIVLLESATKSKFLRPTYLTVSSEELCGFWARSFFVWVLPLFRTGYSTVISISDLPQLDHDLKGNTAEEKLQGTWKEAKGRRRLIKALFWAYSWPILAAIVPRVSLIVFTLCQPFLIAATVNWIGSEVTEETSKYGQGLIGAYVLVYSAMAITTAIYNHQINRLATMIRAGLISMIYKKTTLLKANEFKGAEAITLMETDVDKIMTAVKNLHESWASILQAGVAIWLLERQVYVACVVPTIVSLACVYLTGPVSSRIGATQKAWVERVQQRLAITSTMLGNMKAAQMLGLREVLFKIINDFRELELLESSRYRKLLIIVAALSNVPPDFAPYAMFLTYGIIAIVGKNQTLLTAQAFASLSLISLVTSPLLIFVQSIPNIRQASGCFERIQEFFLKDIVTPRRSCLAIDDENSGETSHEGIEMSSMPTNNSVETQLVEFKDTSISWSKDSEVVLLNLNISIHSNKVIMIVGPVGSGKSLFLESMIGETTIRRGTIKSALLLRAAYCPQTSWIINNTIRHNITGGSDFDQKWYDFAVSSCALQDDLDKFQNGDQYEAGSDGNSLSGGQKQRVALARAVYSRLPTVILDDVFSGLDARSVNFITKSLFSLNGYFRKSKTSVILATHNLNLLPYADEIIVLNDGKIADHGSYRDISARNPEIIADSTFKEEKNITSPSEDVIIDASVAQVQRQANNGQDGRLKETVDVLRRDGVWAVYKYYVQRAGPYVCAVYFGVVIAQAFTAQYATVWLQKWSAASEEHPNNDIAMYLGIYTLIFACSFISFLISCWLILMKIITNTSRGLHTDLLKATLGAPISFFQTNDNGSLVNRFSQDISLVDNRLPIYAYNFTSGVAMCIVILVFICVMGKYFAITIPFLVAILWAVQLYYLRTSRQVRLLDIEAKAPLYSQFMETVAGVSVIRTMNWHAQFQSQCEDLLNRSQKPLYMLYCIQQWLKLVLDLIVMAMAVIIVTTATLLNGQISPGAIGVALTLVLMFNENLTNMIQSWTLTEISIGAVARIQRFATDTPSEKRLVCNPAPSCHEWPSKGAVQFANVTASYSEDMSPVLKKVSLTIEPGQKVAICGTSGSGKTSLILSLLQMIDLQFGKIFIDGIDLATLDRDDIRGRISVIPQEPFFIPGSLKFNLDPHNRVSNEIIESSLNKVGLWARVKADGGLKMAFIASDWSVGERQLFALARALALRSPILILDEATSSVDWETEATMQQIIDKEFAAKTVIAVVHRLRFISQYDKVALLKSGELMEYGGPQDLLNMNSEFKKLHESVQMSR
ncbi:putative multidrug resistance-associated protein [Talaromyces proteolyticus]|uniref:Multidrug resistance-associated protein n=1 Tax=Talaromyces proteolyticus TaxID=1131652 RepID=A0AAD4KD01_9EURO|nr:putative multidrug resistance-associated protein [Talaromyces proteolyticus]KAH8689094.1 putative multidrug resistance-associated protein [Talaromyces proteolyticus]